MQLLVLLSGELASIKVNKKKTREYFQQQEKIGFTVCVFDFFLMLKLAREVVIPVQTQDFSVVQACDFMCI